MARGETGPRRGGAAEALAAASRRAPALRGKGELAQRLMDRAERRGQLAGSWRLQLRDGTRLELPRRSAMSWAVAFEGGYDRATVDHVLRHVEAGCLVLDVGASLGLWTVPLARAARAGGGAVWAFEPNPNNTTWIRRNVELNGLADVVTVRETGLGDEPGELTLVSAEYGVGNAAIAMREREGSEKFPRMQVPIERLDEVALPARVGFVKIDTEGFEPAFLRGARELLARDRPVVFGEFSPYWMRQRGEQLRPLLAELGYTAAALRGARSRPWRPIDTVTERPLELDSPAPLPGNLVLRPL